MGILKFKYRDAIIVTENHAILVYIIQISFICGAVIKLTRGSDNDTLFGLCQKRVLATEFVDGLLENP